MANETAKDSPKLPTTVGPYRIERELGRGAHGIVYRAFHRDMPDRPLALKVIESRGAIDRLMVEPEILSKLRHPNIVGLSDYFLDGDRLVVALEFIDGVELKEYLAKRGPLSPREVREFLRQMAGALDHAHAAGVLHRDIKPTNILIEERPEGPRFVLTDFGISRIAEGIQISRRQGGTYLFMAPEQMRGRPGQGSDLWALGVVAYLMLTGQPPFTGQTLDELAPNILFHTPPLPRDLVPEFDDADLEMIVLRLLDKQPRSRVASGKELLALLGMSQGSSAAEANAASLPSINGGTYEAQSSSDIFWHWVWFVVCSLFMLGPLSAGQQLFVMAGAALLYYGQLGDEWLRRTGLTIAGLLCFAIAVGVSAVLWRLVLLAFGPYDSTTFTIGISTLVCGLFLPYRAMYHFSEARRISRERELRQAIAERSTPELLGELVEVRPGDVSLAHRYIESLLGADRTREAAVEAGLLHEQDPYDLNTALLLAHAYFELQLWKECAAICDQALSVTSYSFELSDLRDAARAKLAAAVQGVAI